MAASTLAAIQGINSAGQAYNQSQAQRAQGEYQKAMADMNANQARLQAEDAAKRGETAAAQRDMATKRQVASQRVAAAAGGVDVASEQVTDITDETKTIGAADVAAIRTNAWREAFGFKSQAENYQFQGESQSIASKNASRMTMLSGAVESAGYGIKSYGEFKKESAARKEAAAKEAAKKQKGY